MFNKALLLVTLKTEGHPCCLYRTVDLSPLTGIHYWWIGFYRKRELCTQTCFKSDLFIVTFFPLLFLCVCFTTSYLMEDERPDVSSVRKTVAPFPATVYSLKSPRWCSDCGFVNLNFSVCSDAGWCASLWIISISVSVPLNCDPGFTLQEMIFALLTGLSRMQRISFYLNIVWCVVLGVWLTTFYTYEGEITISCDSDHVYMLMRISRLR